jgi:hypothetical protein
LARSVIFQLVQVVFGPILLFSVSFVCFLGLFQHVSNHLEGQKTCSCIFFSQLRGIAASSSGFSAGLVPFLAGSMWLQPIQLDVFTKSLCRNRLEFICSKMELIYMLQLEREC